MKGTQRTLPFFSLNRGRAGISPVIATIVLIIAAIALGLLVASLAGGLTISLGRQEGFHIIDARAYHSPTSGQTCVSVTFKNMGSSTITGISARVISPTSSGLTPGSTTLSPGAATSATGCLTGSSVVPGSVIVVQIDGTTGSGTKISTIVQVPVV